MVNDADAYGAADRGLQISLLRQEPAHIHVRTPDGECKFWLEPTIRLASNRGVRPHDLRRVEQLVFEHEVILRKAFDDYHNR
jgi:hypothetical protein